MMYITHWIHLGKTGGMAMTAIEQAREELRHGLNVCLADHVFRATDVKSVMGVPVMGWDEWADSEFADEGISVFHSGAPPFHHGIKNTVFFDHAVTEYGIMHEMMNQGSFIGAGAALAKTVDVVVAWEDRTVEFWKSICVGTGVEVVKVPKGVEIRPYMDDARRIDVLTGEPLCMVPGRFHYGIKNPALMIAGYNTFHHRYAPSSKLFMLTDDYIWREMSIAMSAAHHMMVLPTSNLKGDRQMAPYYNAADIYLHPTMTGELSREVIEAMACGCAIVSVNPFGPTDSFGRDIYKKADPDANEIAIVLASIWEVMQNGEREDYRDIHREQALKFDIKYMVHAMVEVYNHILKGSPLPTDIKFEEVFDEAPVDYYNEVANMPHYRCVPEQSPWVDVWSEVLSRIEKDERILDIGCGSGQFARMAVDGGHTYMAGVDFSEVFIKIAKQMCKTGNFFELDITDVDTWAAISMSDLEYDVAVFIEVLEHINLDLETLSMVKPGKKVVLTVPNFGGKGHVRWSESAVHAAARYKDIIKYDRVYGVIDMPAHIFGEGKKIFVLSGIRKDP